MNYLLWHWDYETDYYHIYNDDDAIVITAPQTEENDDAIREIVHAMNAAQQSVQPTAAGGSEADENSESGG